MAVLNEILGIPCTIYIDDTIAFGLGRKNGELVKELLSFFGMVGLKMSTQKEETILQEGDSMVALGMIYKKSKEGEWTFFPPEKKLEKIDKLAETITETKWTNYNQAREGEQKKMIKLLQQFTGNITFSLYVQYRGVYRNRLKHIYNWTEPEKMQWLSQCPTRTKALITTVQASAKQARAAPPLLLGREFNREKMLMASDAALPLEGDETTNPAMGGSVVRTGSTEGDNVTLEYTTYKLPVKNVRGPATVHIGVCELWAILIAIHAHSERMKDKIVFFQVDNVGAAISLTGGFSHCPMQMALVSLILELIESLDLCVIWVFVPSARNDADWVTRPALLKRFRSVFSGRAVEISSDNLVNRTLFDFRRRLRTVTDELSQSQIEQAIDRQNNIRAAYSDSTSVIRKRYFKKNAPAGHKRPRPTSPDRPACPARATRRSSTDSEDGRSDPESRCESEPAGPEQASKRYRATTKGQDEEVGFIPEIHAPQLRLPRVEEE
jgi:hypothetical protein